MIVVDASALVELLLWTKTGREIAELVADPRRSLHVPHLVDLEIAQALRRMVRSRSLDARAAAEALETLALLDLERHGHEPLLGRVWALRDNLTAYDAVYVALAEALECRVLTCDARLAQAPGLSRRVQLVE